MTIQAAATVRHLGLAAAALAMATTLAACGNASTPGPPPAGPPSTFSVPSSSPGESSDPAPTSSPVDELARGSARHVVRSGGLSVTIDYAAAPPRWTSDAGTTLQLAVSVRDDRSNGRKIYLSKATLSYGVDDGTSSLQAPDPSTDSANIDPGYLVTAPNQYVQLFTVPPLDRAAQNLTLVAKLEFVALVDKKSKDYTKRSVSDQVRTVVSS